jgi:uncharacterized protein
MLFEQWIQIKNKELKTSSIQAVMKLSEEGATVPFMARYRKEVTGNLDEVQIRDVVEGMELWAETLKRKAYILEEIQKQGKLTEPLKKEIDASFSLDRLEEIYLPFKLKKKTKAMLAKEAGLENLALSIWDEVTREKICQQPLLPPWDTHMAAALNKDLGFDSPEKVSNGIVDILAERISENLNLKQLAREYIAKEGAIVSRKTDKAKPAGKFERYFDYKEAISSLMKVESSHRYLALRRGWNEEELVVSVEGMREEMDDAIIRIYAKSLLQNANANGKVIFERALRQAVKVNILMSLHNEFHKALKDSADAEAIRVFVENLRQLLMAAPFGPKCVLAVDPGIRTGSKWALIESSGKMSAHGVFYLQSERERSESKKVLLGIVKNLPVESIAVGNGTFGRETQLWIKDTLKGEELGRKLPLIVPVNESGASIYSAGDVARAEFPDLDVTVRGAISIGRRLQDPLAELVKIDPKSIGVGQYQHDVSQPRLKKSLEILVDSCVNEVGVNLNTASEYLLARVSGIGATVAKNIVAFRQKNGIFKSRKMLLEVSRFSDKVFEQSAGFLRVPESDNPLDNTAVHPERYLVLEKRARDLGSTIQSFIGRDGVAKLKSDAVLKEILGPFTFKDVLEELERPGRDPREGFDPQSFRDDISKMEDLKPGMKCPGVITNVTNFGAFVDIGVHQDALIHISQLSDAFVKDPREVVKPGQKVEVRVLEVNLEKRQIAASMKSEPGTMSMPRSSPQFNSQANPGGMPRSSNDKRSPMPNRSSGDEGFKDNPFAKLKGLKLG